MSYGPSTCQEAMDLFDELPVKVRDQLNYGSVTQNPEDVHIIERLVRLCGEAYVMGLLRRACAKRDAGDG